MAMSLYVLQPVLWSTRLLLRTPQMGALACKHLLKGRSMSTAYQPKVLLPYRSSSLCNQHGFCTALATETQINNKNNTTHDTVIEKMQATKTAEELLQLVENCPLTVSNASYAIHMLTVHCHNNAQNTKQALRKVSIDPRLMKLNKKIMHDGRKLSNHDMVRSLLNCYKLEAKNKNAIIDVLVPALRHRLRSMDVFSLSQLVINHNVLSVNKHSQDLVYEAARVIELRWREMNKLSPATFNRLLQVTAHFPQNFKTFITDKVLESLDKFSFAELVQIASTLAYLPLRSIAVLRAIAYQAIQQSGQWELLVVQKLLVAMGILSFHHQSLTQQTAEFVQEKASEWSPNTVGTIAKALTQLRMPQTELFNAMCSFAMDRLADFTTTDLKKLLYAFGDLGFKPQNEIEFYEKVLSKVVSDLSGYANYQKIHIASALMLAGKLPESIMKDVLETKQDYTKESAKLTHTDLLLMRINTHARLACSEYTGPYLEVSILPDTASYVYKPPPEQSVWQTLQMALGEGAFLRTHVWTTLGYKLDALILIDDNNKPAANADYQLPDSIVNDTQDKKPIPAEFQKIAVLIWNPKHMLVDKDKLTGRCVMQKKHLKLAGYKIVEVSFTQWNAAKTQFQKLSLIKFKLAEAILPKGAK